MKDSSFYLFVGVALIALGIGSQEGLFLTTQQIANIAAETKNRQESANNLKSRREIQELQKNQVTIGDASGRVLNGLMTDPPDTESFSGLRQADIEVTASTRQLRDTFRYDFTTSKVEFHRFLPALTALENQNPLLRVVTLEMETAAGPFYKKATALNIRGTSR